MLAILLLLVAIFAGPPLLQRELQKRLTAELGREVVVGKLRFNPVTLAATSHDFRILEPNGLPLLAWRRLHVNLQLSSLWSGAWVLKRFEVSDPLARLVVQPDGSLNISDLIERFTAQPEEETEPSEPRHLRVGYFSVDGATFDFEDHARELPFRTAIGPVTFVLENFVTHRGDAAPYDFTAVSEAGERFHWRGDVSAVPLRSAGDFEIESVVLSKYASYTQPHLNGEVRDGRMSFSGHYVADFSTDRRQVELTNGAVRLENLVLLAADNPEPILELPSVAFEGLAAQLEPLQVRLASATVQGGRTRVLRDASGNLELMQLWKGTGEADTTTPAPDSPPATEPIDARVEQFTVSDFAFAWRDASTPRQAVVEGVVESLDLRQLTLAPDTPAELSLRVGVQPEAHLEISGQLQLNPVSLSIETTLEAWPLGLASPYLEPLLPVQLTRGTVALSGQLEAALDDAGTPSGSWEGTVGVSDLAVVTAADPEALASFEQLALRDVSVRYSGTAAIQVNEVELAGARLRLVIDREGKLNVATLLPEKTADAPAEESEESVAVPESSPPAHEITIGQTRIRDTALVFDDRSIEPAAHATIDQVDLSVGRLSTAAMDQAEATLHARINGSGRAELSGRMNPLNPSVATELALDVQNVDLRVAAPYIAKYAGYLLDRGQLNLDLDYAIADRQLRATNVVRLDQFTLGAPSGSPDATNLPVTLAVALLKDRQGVIELDVPVEGNLDDPSFRLGRVIGRVVVNLLTRAATSPFALLGALMPGGDQVDPSQVMFAAGVAELTDAEREKLQQVAIALQERPALRLDIAGSYAPEEDRRALQTRSFEQTLQRRWWEHQRARDPNTPAPEQLELAAEARESVVRRWYFEMFPQDLVLSAESVQALTTGENPPVRPRAETEERSPGPVRRFFQALGLARPAEEAAEDTAEAEVAMESVIAAAGPDVATMEERLLEGLTIEPAELEGLADARAQLVRSSLIEAGVEAERIFLSTTTASGPRAALQLR